MNLTMRRFLFILMGAVVGLSLMAAIEDLTPAQRKSNAYLMAGIQRDVEGDKGEAHELFKRAYRLNPQNHEAAYSYGLSRAMMAEDSTEMEGGLALMRQYVEAYPQDYDDNYYYAYLQQRLGNLTESARVMEILHKNHPDKDEITGNLADMSAATGNNERALELYTEMEKSMGYNPMISLRKMTVYLGAKDTVAALREVDRLIATDPADPDFYLLKSTVMDYVGMKDSVFPYLEKARRVAPESGHVKMALATYYQTQGDSVAYDEQIYAALLTEDVELEDKLDLLTDYIQPVLEQKKATEHADYLLNTLIDQYPHEAVIQDYAARYEAYKGDYNEAADRARIAIDMEPDNIEYQGRHIQYLTAAGQFPAAIAAFEAVQPDSTRSPALRIIGAYAYMGAERNDKARDEVNGIITTILPDVNPADTLKAADINILSQAGLSVIAECYSILGDLSYRADDMAATTLAYDNALTANPDDAGALNNFAFYLCEKGGDLDKAHGLSQRAIDMEPENSTYLDTYAWILFRQAKYADALPIQLKAVENASTAELTYELYEHLGDIMFMAGDPKGAVEQWQNALKLAPDRDILRRKVKNKTFFYE